MPKKNKELSIFIDELGDFGEYSSKSPYYIVSMVFHNQDVDINKNIDRLEKNLKKINKESLVIHTGPIIREEYEYRHIEKEIRKNIFNAFVSFVKHLDIKAKTFIIYKKDVSDVTDMTGKLSKQISVYVREKYLYFSSYDKVKIYYDNGQVELSKVLASVFNALLENVEFKKVLPKDYRLLQVADLFCTVENLILKIKHNALSNSEKAILGRQRDIKRNIIKQLVDKMF